MWLLDEAEAASQGCPFPDALDDPEGRHFGFLQAVSHEIDLEGLEAPRTARERFRRRGDR